MPDCSGIDTLKEMKFRSKLKKLRIPPADDNLPNTNATTFFAAKEYAHHRNYVY
jgi:hypothetical protein